MKVIKQDSWTVRKEWFEEQKEVSIVQVFGSYEVHFIKQASLSTTENRAGFVGEILHKMTACGECLNTAEEVYWNLLAMKQLDMEGSN